MADITMCSNEECPLEETCYRKQARQSDWQSWSKFDYEVSEAGEVTCDYYWEV